MTWFNNFKVIFKILSLVFVLLMITAAISYIGYNSTYQINAASDDQDVSTGELNIAHTLYEQAMEMNTTTDELSISQSKEIVAESMETDKAAQAAFEDGLKKLHATADEKQTAELEKIEAAYKAYIPALNNVLNLAASFNGEASEENIQKLSALMKLSEKPNDELKALLKGYVDYSVAENRRVTDGATATYKVASELLIISSILAMLIGVSAGSAIAVFGVTRPLGKAVDNLKSLINDDLQIEIANAHRKDEVGDVAKAAQTFKEVLIKNKAMIEAEKVEIDKKLVRQQRVAELISNFDINASETVATVAAASTQLSQTAENMSVVAGNTNQQSIEVASASEQASHNVQSVASAAEEMAATVQEISRQIAMSNDVVRGAMEKAEAADNSSRELVDMSKSVGTIATLIEDIAGQINLLALNATIESARSGEAGKGFAVVANEVKNLATQTAKATEQIRQQLDAVQRTAVGVADMLGGVRSSIADVSQSSAAIAAAVEEQSAATHEIVSNMNTATQGVEQINSGIFAIKGGTDSTTAATREVLDAAKMLSVQAEKMDAEVKTFLTNIQAA